MIQLLSKYLFVAAVETLALAVRQNTEIIGIKIGGEETKLLQYADDTTAVLSDIRLIYQQNISTYIHD